MYNRICFSVEEKNKYYSGNSEKVAHQLKNTSQ